MQQYTFPPGRHDEFICAHILKNVPVNSPIEHIYHEDGSVTVTFPETVDVEAREATYSRETVVEPKPFDIQRAVINARLRRLEEGN